jgi:uncharacterized membrane protein
MNPKELSLGDLYGSDPIGRFALGTLRVKPIFMALFFIASGAIYAGILPRFWGYPLEVDGVNLINILLVFPAAGYFYARQPHSILRTYTSVFRYMRGEDPGYPLRIEEIIKFHARSLWWIIGAIFGLLGAGFGISYSVQHFGEFWYSANWFQILFVHAVRFLAFYCIGVATCRHIAASIELNSLFEHAELPLTLDADRLEVFSNIRNFALEFVGVAAIIALNLGLQPLFIDPPILEYSIYVGLYFIVAPASFFMPLWEAQKRMSKIKNVMLDKLHYEYQEESQRLYRKLESGAAPSEYVKESETLERLGKTIQSVSRASDWPFQINTFYRLSITVVSPFILILLEIGVNLLLGT